MTTEVPGVYGMRLLGIEPDPSLLPRVRSDAPVFHVTRANDEGGKLANAVVHELIDGAGSMAVDALDRRVEFRLAIRLTDDELVHPWLAPAAAAMALHDGHLALHGGVLETGGRCVAVLGDREAGKSTLVAAAARQGLGVMTDDVIVLDASHRVHAGPRCIDLRSGSAGHFAMTSGDLARSGTRHRMSLAAVPSTADLAAVVILGWGSELSLTPLTGAAAAKHLLPHLASARHESAFVHVLKLGQVPHFALSRPQDFTLLEASLDMILGLTGAA